MPKDIQSINDLMESSTGKMEDDESIQSKFYQKSKEIKSKELEESAEEQAVSSGYSYMDLFGFPISPEALSIIKEDDAKKDSLICFFYDGKKIRLASTNPSSDEVKNKEDEIKNKYHCKTDIYFISSRSLEYALKIYKSIPKVREFKKEIAISEEKLNQYSENFSSFNDLQDEIKNANVSDIVAIIMASSIKSGASDIHIEAEEKNIKVRFRIDGVLHTVASFDNELWKKIISRLKVIAKVKINIDDKPQDGRISISTNDERIDIRASFLPTSYGESVVMRLLRSSSVGLEFKDLGIRDRAFKKLEHEVNRPNGMIITTGPTGSGKTTTLYAVLKKLNNQETKIITVEDPIEYQLEGINQSQVGKNYTFAKALRSIVRQDPDVIMVGEIRDLETAETAIQAALTGHLVLSTIHTNDAAGAIPRFLSMGAKSFLLSPAINAIIGQRLVRKICEGCKEEDFLEDEKIEEIKKSLNKLPEEEKNNIDFDNLKFYKGKGCKKCQGLGYKGRIGIYEIVIMNNEIEKLILSGNVSEYDMRDIANRNGTVSMFQDGLIKALEGITSISEVFRVAEDKN